VRRGDVVLVVVPSELGRPRPGVIVQSDQLTGLSTAVVCPLSSDVQNDLPLRPIVEPDGKNGLRIRSQIMTDKLLALKRDRIRTVLGKLDDTTVEQLDRALLVILGLAR
jgi:mRNA interferase MazF